MLKYISQFILMVVIGFFIFSCEENQITSNPNHKLSFTADTITFDTIFTTIGSTTDWFKVKNENHESIVISEIFLAGGENSPFRININGEEAIEKRDIKIAAGDSMFVFIAVTIDPTGQNNPMVFNDSVVFITNGNTQDVNLIAFGQDFHLFNGEEIQSQHWLNDKPYLVYNSLKVDSLSTLTIDAGCRIHFHKKSSLFIEGTLKVNGTFNEPVTFQGDRLEEMYEDVPGQWGDWYEFENGSIYIYGGIHFFLGSHDNVIDYAIIKNAEKGIQCDSLGFSENPMLVISNSRVENMTLNCLDARTSNVVASNCIFANSGSYSVKLILGGDYRFSHCTLANYFNINKRNEPTLIINDSYEYENKIYDFDLNVLFGNSIIYGNEDSELSIYRGGDKDFNYIFSHCLIKTNGNPDFTGNRFPGSVFDLDPMFTDVYENNYKPDSLSPARNIGDIELARLFPFDIYNNSRLDDVGPDMGAIEWIPTPEEK